MLNRLSRRRWLLSASVMTLGASFVSHPLHAAEPSDRIGARPTQASQVSMSSTQLGEYGVGTVVTAIAADPRGEFIAAAGDDHRIRIMKTSNLVVVRTLVAHRDIVRTLSFDAAGSQLVSAGNDGQLIVWNRDESFRVVQQMNGSPALARVQFSPDGREIAAVGFENEVFLMGRGKGYRVELKCDCQDLRAVAYRDDGEMLAVAGRCGNLHLFDPRTGAVKEHRIHTARIHDTEFLRDSDLAVSVAEDGQVSLFNTETHQLRTIPVTGGKLFAVSVLTPKLIAVAGSDDVIRIINMDDGSIVRTLRGHNGTVSALDASHGLLFSGSYDATLRRWSIGDIVAGQQRIAEGDPRLDR
ncbi:MAG: WD40 repeat domain-containing protein [Rubripirellula sp.]